jgi:hypothetical protein
VEIAQGDLWDFDSVTAALKGITGAYFMYPIQVRFREAIVVDNHNYNFYGHLNGAPVSSNLGRSGRRRVQARQARGATREVESEL